MIRRFLISGATCFVILGAATWFSVKPVETDIHAIASDIQTLQITDRNGISLTVTYQNRWNAHDYVALHDVPELLKAAFLISEDRRFYDHDGVDWRARGSALWQNIRRGETMRGASTITEQTVRMINPRPRNIWSKWLEGWEAAALERSMDKAAILEFYINQIPYAANRRGIVQAARYYFNRDLSTLSPKEMLALVVMARAPSAYDLYKNPGKVDGAIERLAQKLGINTGEEDLVLSSPADNVNAQHFVRYVRLNTSSYGNTVRTTLDASLQKQVQDIIDQRVRTLSVRNVHNAAALVADHQTGEILAWVVAGAGSALDLPAEQIDAVTTPRQPGSSMKPFLYAVALEKGWTAATVLDDSPLADAIGTGLHRYRNYSNLHYGPVSVRTALGNSLNIPALHAIRYVGPGAYLTKLQDLGFSSLDRSSEIYDEGLALGAGEVTLLELTQAYAALANGGVYRKFRIAAGSHNESHAVFSHEVSSLIGNILSDPAARELEFGEGSVLNLPVQTAVKTGTSTDFRDAWVAGYNDRYVVGIWMGNLDNQPMNEVTGSTGPALAMRSIFSLLNRYRETRPLYLSHRLITKTICCPKRTEWFVPGTEPTGDVMTTATRGRGIELVRPTDGLLMAVDPRVPKENQKFRFELSGLEEGDRVNWIVNGDLLGKTWENRFLWPVERGMHHLAVSIERKNGSILELKDVNFTVK